MRDALITQLHQMTTWTSTEVLTHKTISAPTLKTLFILDATWVVDLSFLSETLPVSLETAVTWFIRTHVIGDCCAF